MHLHDDMLIVCGLAVDVVYQRAVFIVYRGLLLVEEGDVNDGLLTHKQTVEKAHQQRLGELLTENALEADVAERIDEFCHGHRY